MALILMGRARHWTNFWISGRRIEARSVKNKSPNEEGRMSFGGADALELGRVILTRWWWCEGDGDALHVESVRGSMGKGSVRHGCNSGEGV
jgi:hypothetical protein